jgi:anti-sigma regulatory factor (Ser/Thr protein kinase)
MEDLSLHILDIVENSITAGARNVEIIVREHVAVDRLTIEITDDGKGMNPEAAGKVADPFFTTRSTRRVGLGVPLLEQAARQANGTLDVWSVPGVGTKVKATFQRSHIDRKPLGNIAETMITLVVGNSDVDFTYRHERNGEKFTFDTKEIKARQNGWDLKSPDGLTFIRDYLTQQMAVFL